jgi:hypothetical protein
MTYQWDQKQLIASSSSPASRYSLLNDTLFWNSNRVYVSLLDQISSAGLRMGVNPFPPGGTVSKIYVVDDELSGRRLAIGLYTLTSVSYILLGPVSGDIVTVREYFQLASMKSESIELTTDNENHWLASWVNNGDLWISYSGGADDYDWGLEQNCTKSVVHHQVAALRVNEWLIVYQTQDNNEVYAMVTNGTCISSVLVGTGEFRLATLLEEDDLIMIITDNGNIYQSLNGIDWNFISVGPANCTGFIGLGNQTWLLTAQNQTWISADDGSTWTIQLDLNTPNPGIIFIRDRLIQAIHYFEGALYRSYRNYTQPLNLMCDPHTCQLTDTFINQDLVYNGNLLVNGSLDIKNVSIVINGNLVLGDESKLRLMLPLNVTGTFAPGGQVNTTGIIVGSILVHYGEIDGTFDKTIMDTCTQLQYRKSNLQLITSPSCANDTSELPLWVIIVCVVVGIILIICVGVIMFWFKNKVFIFRRRVKEVQED